MKTLTSIGLILGTAIGSFAVALAIGVIFGHLCNKYRGNKTTKKEQQQQGFTNAPKNCKKFFTGIILEEVKPDEHIETSANMSYEAVKTL